MWCWRSLVVWLSFVGRDGIYSSKSRGARASFANAGFDVSRKVCIAALEMPKIDVLLCCAVVGCMVNGESHR
jgi:hypothetical protein